ncbi:MAG: DUF3800 domain-containing protein [Candidatus Kerfeldbacteria bacterium]|nr:DUF3800 domain-containing protein [Candidatus Kerfeldbacteria bacterium]
MYAIFLDESGQLTKNPQQPYFVIGSFSTTNPKQTAKSFHTWQRKHFPINRRYKMEIKFNDCEISQKLRLKTIQHIADLDIRICYTIVSHKDIPQEFWYKRQLKSGYLYAEIVTQNIDLYFPIETKELYIYCDKRHLKDMHQQEFCKFIYARILSRIPLGSRIAVKMLESDQHVNIQIADWITGALAAYVNNKSLGKEFYAILQNKIVKGKQLFL